MTDDKSAPDTYFARQKATVDTAGGRTVDALRSATPIAKAEKSD
jgi:hypothetical protein